MIATPATPEQCVVGIMALDSKTILYCIDHLSEDDFADGACKAAFAEIRDLYTSRGYYSEDDVILMRNKDTVMYCAEIMPPISGYRKFVKAVKDDAIRRKAALLGLSLAEDGFVSTPPVWVATHQAAKADRAADVSIHATRVGGDIC